MATTLHALIVEDSESDAELLVRHLQKAEFDVVCERVETAAQMSAKLEESTWDIVIADYRMPLFSAPAALEVLHSSGRDIPFIVVSGTIGEETAVVMMKSGAHDYFLKDSLTRLPAAVRREIREAELRNEKRRSEEAARENEIRFRRMFEDGPIGMAMAGADFRFIRVNEAFCAMLGYTEKEILALTFADLTHPDNLAADLESEKKLRFGEIPIYRTEKRYIRKDKAEVWGALTLSAIHDKDGKFQYFLGSVVDITERKRAEEALRNSELQYRTTIDAINDSIAVIDSDLRIVLVNESFKKWNQHLGLQPGAQGRIILDVLPFLSKDAPQEYARVFSTAETLTTEEHYTFGANEVFAEIRKIPLLEGGRVMRVVTVIRDITDQELSRRRLEEERNLLKTILEAIPEAIAVKDTQRRFILANPATFKALNRK